MSGVVAGLIASVKSAPSAPVNLVTNPSFTTNTNDWYDDFPIAEITRNTTTFRSAPASLNYSGYDGDPFTYYYKTNLLTVGQQYSLSLWIKTFNTQSFTIHLDAGATRQTLTTAEQSSAAAFTNYKIENVTCTTNSTLQVYVYSLYSAYIDDVSVVLGATAVP